MKLWLGVVLCLVVSTCDVRADKTETRDKIYESPVVLPPGHAGVGKIVPHWEATTIHGQKFSLTHWLKGKKAAVLAMTSTTCPLSKKYLASLAKLEKSLAPQKVGIIFINTVATDDVADMKKAYEAHQLQGPYLHDKTQEFIATFRAYSTAEAILLDPARTIVYRGAVDDQYGLGYSKDAPTKNYLQWAVQRFLANERIDVQATEAPGCVIDYSNVKAAKTEVTYHRDISRLIQSHCLECHRKEGVAPFSLESRADLLSRKGIIKKVLQKQTMPPWFAKVSAATHSPFINDRSLLQADRDMLISWLDAGGPEGEAADAPRPRTFAGAWSIGTPDKIYQFAKPVAIKATGTMPYQNVLVDIETDSDKWISAVEIKPSAPQVVHHVLVFIIPKGIFDKKKFDPHGFFAAYVPGNNHQIFKAGFAKKLPKNSRLLFQMHYTPNGTATKDSTQIGLKYTEKPPESEVRIYGLANPKIKIPPHDENYENSATITLPFDIELTGMMPHMHVRGKACKYEVTLPNGKKHLLLDIPRYDFNWQLQYKLAEPMRLPRGTKIKFTAWFDNSDKNPANPDPSKTVTWGPQTFDEMLLGYAEFYLPKN